MSQHKNAPRTDRICNAPIIAYAMTDSVAAQTAGNARNQKNNPL
ncbi:MAG: hypothetical protein AAGB51_01770 [Planctomycetota bacterium]